MDDESIDVDDWRRVCLGDEPIYCAAPPPSNPDDIIYLGSDEELDDAAKVSRRLRYEEQGVRYLQGKPMRILSASLRGPFDKASGWKNPWLPKQSTVEKSFLKSTRPKAKPLPAIKERFRKHLEQGEATPNTGSSMRYQLPSPESSRDLQLFSDPLETDKRSQIQDWAEKVSVGTVLEKDSFWAPGHAPYEDTDEPSRKRPAGKEWLKTKFSKRKRLDSTQVTTVSSPTRMPPTTIPTRGTSLPAHVDQAGTSVVPKKMANQSFQLSTPSSTHQSASEIPYKEPVEASTHCEIILPQDEASNSKLAPEEPTSSLTSITVEDIYDQPFPPDDQDSENISTAGTSSHSSPASEGATSEQAQRSDGAEEETGLESYLDQSFHYRARCPKQMSPVTGLDIPTTEACPEEPQTGTSECPIQEEVVKVEITETEQQRIHIGSVAPNEEPQHGPSSVQEQEIQNKEQLSVSLLLEKTPSNGGTKGGDNRLVECKTTNDQTIIIETGLSQGGKASTEQATLMQIDSVYNLMSPEGALTSHIQTKVKENADLGMTHDDSYKFQALLQGDMGYQMGVPSGDLRSIQTRQGKAEPSVDEESTLVGVPTDSPGSMPPETSGSLGAHDNPDKISVPAELHNMAQNPEDNTAQEYESDRSDGETHPVIAPLSHSEWGVTGVMDDYAEKPKVSSDVERSNLVMKVEEVPEHGVPIGANLLDPHETVTRQSPWVPNLPPGALLTIEHIKSEPPDEPSNSPCPSHLAPLGSHSSGHEALRIRASQQSPWSKGLLGPISIDQQVQCLDIPTKIMSVDVQSVATISERNQSPWVGTNTSFLPYPHNPPVSPIPAAHDKLLLPSLQLSMVSTRTDNQPLEHSIRDPTTPPRMPTPQVRTPDLEKSIKPFAMFNSPSPERRTRQSIRQCSSASGLRGVLSSAPRSNPWSSRRSSRRVSFASLPNEADDVDTLPALNTIRPASPPPQAAVDTEDEDVGVTFQNHFNIMKRRASGENIRPRLQSRLLPSFSQQRPMSPAISAMAEIFQEADAHIARAHEDPVGDINDGGSDQGVADREQSPWRKESQGVDDVAEVMNNLDEFLDAWNVDAELQKANQEPGGGSRGWDWFA
ncbi:hypothetical protein F5Y05DRAFT_380128 [Hypoxylon sp. FL0543]|nr:hypothetical protein F5Y05DRAFT_380128 [Hypoxylon sp. FL0543]